MANPVIHWEIGCKDAAKMQKFFEDLFNWQVERSEELHYSGITAVGEHGISGGINDQLGDGGPYVTFYAMVDDPEKFLEKAKSLGAKAMLGPMDIPEVGSVAVFSEPTSGHNIGLFRPLDPEQAITRASGDTPVVHWEIATTDPARLQDFFEQLFGWEFEIMEKLGYRIAKAGDTFGIGGGILEAKGEIPPYVSVYVYINDLDQYVEKAKSLGGNVIVDPMEISPEVGSMAIISAPDDPNPIGFFKGAND
jgi:predicted enzyme related to lactoylglutathione lyase